MDFERARSLVKLLVIFAAIIALAGLIITDYSASLSFYLTLMSAVCCAAAVVVVALFCKCPYCGKHVTLGLLTATHCPKCRRSFTTGKKKKGKH